MKTPFAIRQLSGSTQAFSLIEVIGVLAVLSILAATLVPNVVRKIAQANASKEEQNLLVLAKGLRTYIEDYQTIPGGASWATDIALVTGLNLNEVLRVNPNDPANERVYLVHPSFTPSTGSNPVFTNTASGSLAPDKTRVIFISTTKVNLTIPVSSGKASDVNQNRQEFEDVWDWNFDPATKAPPSGWPAEWTGNGEHLHVVRMNLVDLFYHVTVNNLHYPTNYPLAKFNDLDTVAYDTSASVDGYYLRGITVRFYKHDTPFTGPPSNPDDLDLTHVIERDVNFIYRDVPGQWSIP